MTTWANSPTSDPTTKFVQTDPQFEQGTDDPALMECDPGLIGEANFFPELVCGPPPTWANSPTSDPTTTWS